MRGEGQRVVQARRGGRERSVTPQAGREELTSQEPASEKAWASEE